MYMKKLHITAIVTAFIGLAISTYLSVVKLINQDVLCFEGMGDCNIVTSSSYSAWRGIPIAFLGMSGYLAILGLLFIMHRQKRESSVIMLALFGVTTFGALFSLYLTYLQMFIIHAFCPWCLTSAIAMLLLFILSAMILVKSKLFNTTH
jgi:uncharacterized membrane protein